jgi:hypothetical protein
MKLLTPLTVLAVLGCGDGPAGIQLDQEFTLALGETVDVAQTGLRITFREVRDDSRCPVDAVCLWAGNATVELVLQRALADTTVAVNTLLEPRAVVSGDYRLELLGLTPQPRIDEPTDPNTYRARLRVATAHP